MLAPLAAVAACAVHSPRFSGGMYERARGGEQAVPPVVPQPRHATPAHEALEAALGEVHPDCRATVSEALSGRDAASRACRGALLAASKALTPERRTRFGVVERRAVDLTGISLVLAEAHRCRRWPLRIGGDDVLTAAGSRNAQCRQRRFSGVVPVYAYRAGEATPHAVAELDVRDGVARLSFAGLERQFIALGVDDPWTLTRLELGDDAWAGQVDLVAVRRILGSFHYEWVEAGLGSPGLFVAAHPDHPRTGDAEALAFEASLADQERDYLAVSRGEMSPGTFLDRHVWSPYRSSVAQMGVGASTGSAASAETR